MDFTVSKDPNLFVCQGSLDAIRVVSQVIVLFDIVISVRFWCRWDQRPRVAWEVLCLEGLKIFLEIVKIMPGCFSRRTMILPR